MHAPVTRAILYGFLGAVGTAFMVGVPTALIPNPVFGRMIPPDEFDYLVFAATVILASALAATSAWPIACPLPERRIAAGSLATFFAVGCPTCNKLVLLLLGSSGAVQWFAPLQPLLGVAGLALLASALIYRLRLLAPFSHSDQPKRAALD
jgi:hypothetical protein